MGNTNQIFKIKSKGKEHRFLLTQKNGLLEAAVNIIPLEISPNEIAYLKVRILKDKSWKKEKYKMYVASNIDPRRNIEEWKLSPEQEKDVRLDYEYCAHTYNITIFPSQISAACISRRQIPVSGFDALYNEIEWVRYEDPSLLMCASTYDLESDFLGQG